MKRLLTLASFLTIASCGSSHVDPNQQKANAQDRAQALCQSTARSKNLRVSSSEEPYMVGHDRYLIEIKTRDAGGVVSRRCDVNLANGRANIY
jgi:hypothetical protein